VRRLASVQISGQKGAIYVEANVASALMVHRVRMHPGHHHEFVSVFALFVVIFLSPFL
jgi:hypothetical protein